jgi:hypothetical protein
MSAGLGSANQHAPPLCAVDHGSRQNTGYLQSRSAPSRNGMNQQEVLMHVKRLFTEHPESVGESYFEHMGVALSFAGPLLTAGLAALVHAVLPFLCVTTASGTVKQLHARMVNRRPQPSGGSAPNRLLGWDPGI